VTVATTAKTSAQLWLTKDLENSWAALMSSGLLVLVFALVPAEPGKKRKKYLLAALVICSIVFPGCGGGSNGGGGGGASGTPSGSYTITVTGTSGSIKQTSTLKLTVQ
jgi:hypothetical protein